jgi:hypothetical protein
MTRAFDGQSTNKTVRSGKVKNNDCDGLLLLQEGEEGGNIIIEDYTL